MASAAALIIGSEILSGKVVDSNSAVLARELRGLGVELRRIVVVPDERPEIVAALRELKPRHDHVFSSGGVGPTHDDVTLGAVAEALGRPLRRNAEMVAVLARHHDLARHPEGLRMADLPEGAELVWGDGIRVPVVVVENLYILPGVPGIFELKLQALRERLRQTPYHLREVFLNEGEVEIASVLDETSRRFPELGLGSYPQMDNPDHRVKLTLESKDRELVERALRDLLERLPPGALKRWA